MADVSYDTKTLKTKFNTPCELLGGLAREEAGGVVNPPPGGVENSLVGHWSWVKWVNNSKSGWVKSVTDGYSRVVVNLLTTFQDVTRHFSK